MQFTDLAKQFKSIASDLGVSQQTIQRLTDAGKVDGPEVSAALDQLGKLLDQTSQLVKGTDVPAEERARKIAELQTQIDHLTILKIAEPDIDKRLDDEREIASLQATLSLWQVQGSLQFEDLIDDDGNTLRSLLDEAGRDIAARQNLARVMAGIQVTLNVTAFGAALAAKLAVASAADAARL